MGPGVNVLIFVPCLKYLYILMSRFLELCASQTKQLCKLNLNT